MDSQIQIEHIDPLVTQRTVDMYRRVIAALDKAISKREQAKFQMLAKRLRTSWKEWQGEDTLHEISFGEPLDE